jgi:anthranilate synthase component 1
VKAPLERSTRTDAHTHSLAWATWPADCATPVRLYLALRAAGHRACLLESVEGPARLARYSFVGVDPTASLRGNRVRDVEGERELAPDSLSALREALRRAPSSRPPLALPPFCGGWVGFFTYEWARALEPRVPRAKSDPWQLPDAHFDLFEHIFAIDHAAQRLYVIVACAGESQFARAQERIDALAEHGMRESPDSGELRMLGSFAPCIEREQYLSGVRDLRAAISQGEIFQAVLSQRFEQRFSGDPFTLYRVLRLTNPSPHMFFYEADDLTLIGSSPERLVSVRDRHAENRPIAGTRPRGVDAHDDERLGAELRGDPKERAEHDMLVDLARNDLGRVARIGTVRVREHAVLERFARVQHLVSRVECSVAEGRDALDTLAACFPAGTVSGAPKVRAMELIAGVEAQTRGPYAGCFGYVDGAGSLDMALIIRSFVVRENRLSVQAGAGIVFDSQPEREYQETLAKAAALFEAAQLADSPAFRSDGEVRR